MSRWVNFDHLTNSDVETNKSLFFQGFFVFRILLVMLFFFVFQAVWHARAASCEHAPGRHCSMNADSMSRSQTGNLDISTFSYQSLSTSQQVRSREELIRTACRLQHGRPCKQLLCYTGRTAGKSDACSLVDPCCATPFCTPVSACNESANALACVVA